MPMMLQDIADLVQQGMPPSSPGQLPPGTPPDGLLAQLMPLMSMGSIDQRHKLLQGQFDQGGQLAAGAPVDYSKGRGAPLALAGLVNLVSAGLGGYQQGKATAGLRDLVGEQDAGAKTAGDAVRNAPMSNLQAALMASPEDAPAKMQASQDAIGQRSKLGMMLGLTGNPQLANTGKMLSGEADRDRETLQNLPEARQRLAAGDTKNQQGQVTLQEAIQKLRKDKAAQDALEDPATVATYRATATKLAPGVDFSNVPPAALQHIIPVLEKVFAAQEAANARKDVANTNADARTRAAQASADARTDAQAHRDEQAADKRWTQFGDALDPTKARGGEMAKVVNSLTQYGKVKTLIDQNPDPNSNQMYEMARAFDRAVSGGAATEGGTQHLVPQTALGSFKDFEQWLTNSPVGRNQQAFVKQFSDSVDRETAYGQKLLREWQGKKAARYSDLAKKDQPRFETELMNWGLTPEEFDPSSWAYKGVPPSKSQTFAPSQTAPDEGGVVVGKSGKKFKNVNGQYVEVP